MTNIEILRTYNNWRRDMVGEKTLEDFGITPRMIGEALDAVIKDAERYGWLRFCDYEVEGGFFGVWTCGYDPIKLYQGSDLDWVIDAAMTKESRQ